MRSLVLAAAALCVVHGVARAHPLHTTLTEVTLDPSRHALHIVIRVFADDFGKAVATGRRTGGVAPDAVAYLRTSFVVSDGRRSLPLRPCGTRRSGELLWICLETDAPASVASLQLRDALLWELFDDQVNIVRSLLGPAPHSILFTRGDRSKALS